MPKSSSVISSTEEQKNKEKDVLNQELLNLILDELIILNQYMSILTDQRIEKEA